jgi:hypothetical protein
MHDISLIFLDYINFKQSLAASALRQINGKRATPKLASSDVDRDHQHFNAYHLARPACLTASQPTSLLARGPSKGEGR